MKAVGVARFGGPETLDVFEVPDRHAGPGQVRIRVHAATVNPGDRYLRNGSLGPHAPTPPYIPGMEAAGIVDQIGVDTVTDLRVGDRVMAVAMPTASGGGAYAEYVAVPAQWAAHAPAGSSHAEAATLPMNGLTARLALDRLGLKAGQTLAVTGGAGAVGGYAVQMATADGIRVIADASSADRQLLRTLGADIVIPRSQDVAHRIREVVPDGVDAILDGAVIGSARMVAAVRDGGAIATVLGEGSRAVSPAELHRRSLQTHMIYVPDYFGAPGKLERLREQAEAGALTMRVGRTFTPEQASEAHRLMEAGGTRGRLVLEF
ncbi:NADP-dependent oxidoreductase [Streptomyces sp. NPDC001833]|uniref:quinone oxidoreductase family protein n=1 Tax=Streptomyces sp. NPDC001833 TaxID=3154658 RepID=UPI00331F1D13